MWPFERINRSRLKKSGVCGEYTITYFQRATPMAAMPIAPLFLMSDHAPIIPMGDLLVE